MRFPGINLKKWPGGRFAPQCDDSNRSLLLLEAQRYFLRHLFASTFVYQTVSSTDNRRQQAKRLKQTKFTYMQISPPVQLGQNWYLGRPPNPWLASDWKQTPCVKIKRRTDKLPPVLCFYNLIEGTNHTEPLRVYSCDRDCKTLQEGSMTQSKTWG